MIDFIKINLKLICRNKKFKNYMLIYFLSIIILIGIIILSEINEYNMERVINEESNREIIITNYESFTKLENFINDNIQKIEKVDYFLVKNILINNENYVISTNNEFNEDTYSIKINRNVSLHDNVLIKDIIIKDFIYDNNLSDNQIIINQKLAKYLYSQNYLDTVLITMHLKKYNDIENFLSTLENNSIVANSNVTTTETMKICFNLKYILNFIIAFFLIVVSSIILIFMYNFIAEQKNNTLVSYLTGYSITRIIFMYIFDTLILVFINLLIAYFLSFLLLILLEYVFSIKILTSVTYIMLIILLYIFFLNIFVIITSILFFKKSCISKTRW